MTNLSHRQLKKIDYYQSPYGATKQTIKIITKDDFYLCYQMLTIDDRLEITKSLCKDLNKKFNGNLDIYFKYENLVRSLFFSLQAKDRSVDFALYKNF